jgi:resuscitation-promoting factor RpfA
MVIPRLIGALIGWLVGLAGATLVLLTSTGPLLARLDAPGAGADATVATAAAVLGWLVLGWLALGVVLTLVDVLTGVLTAAARGPLGQIAGALTPAVVSQAVRRSIRVGLVAGAVGTAVVTPTVAFASSTLPAADISLTHRTPPPTWPVLDRPAHPVPAAVSRATTASSDAAPSSPTRAPGARYRVRPGDSLWSIAAQHLPPGASQAEVARAWPRWWRVNRDVVGTDPSLIRPGQVLRVPETAS